MPTSSWRARRAIPALALRPGALLLSGLAALLLLLLLDSPWNGTLWDSLLVTLLAVLTPQDRREDPGGLAVPRLARLLNVLLPVGLYLAVRLLTPWGASAALPFSGRLAAAFSLLCWAALLGGAGELLLRLRGPGWTSLNLLLWPALVLLTAPISLGPLFPGLIRPALALCPLVSASWAQGLDAIHMPEIYDLTPLDSLEFHYPPWYLHPLIALFLASACWQMAGKIQEHRR